MEKESANEMKAETDRKEEAEGRSGGLREEVMGLRREREKKRKMD